MYKKYIVKNCPAIKGINSFCGDNRPEVFCSDCTNCLTKQVIEKCWEEFGIKYNDIDQGRNYLANELFQLFKIREVE